MRETKYNQNSNSRKAPIDRDALWGKIKTDPTFPVPEPKNRRRFWLFGGLGILLLAMVFVVNWSTAVGSSKSDLSKSDQQTKLNQVPEINNQVINQEINKDKLTPETLPTNKEQIPNTKQPTQLQSKKAKTDSKIKKSNVKAINGPTLENSKTPMLSKAIDMVSTSVKSDGHGETQRQVDFITQNNNVSLPINTSDQSQQTTGLQTQLNPITTLGQLDFSLDLPLARKVKDYQEELTELKPKIGLLAYANVSYGLSMHNVETIEEREGYDFLDPNVTDYLKNRESRAIEIGIKKTLFKRYRLGLGAEFRQDWQAYERTTTEINAARDTSIILAGFPLQKTTTEYLLHQKYQSVNLNLSVDRIIPLGWAYLELGAGIGYSIGKESKAKVLDIENTLIDRVATYPLKSAESFSGFGQLGLTLPLSENWRLSVNARYNLPTQLSRNIEEYSHKLSAIRLGMAIGYEF